MRRSLCLLPFLLCACGNSATGATASDDAGGSDATGEQSDAGVQPDTTVCSGDPTTCLFGTTQTEGFIVSPTRLRARLYQGFLAGGGIEIGTQIVAKDHTWAFSGLQASAHYYVQFEQAFLKDAGVMVGALTRVGPLAVPASPGAPIAVTVKPVQLDVFEQSSAGSAMQVLAASAHLAEMNEGTASVSILIGTTQMAMPYDNSSSQLGYYLQFATPVPAQATYQITTSLTSVAAQATWNLVADPPQFVGTITSPPAGATVPANMDLKVQWASQPAADYQRVELFRQQQNVYTSPHLDPAEVTSETIPANDAGPGPLLPGSYTISVAFTKANCPATADGCVHASTLASEQITAQ